MGDGEVYIETKKDLSVKVFNLTSAYDYSISDFIFNSINNKEYLELNYLNRSYVKL